MTPATFKNEMEKIKKRFADSNEAYYEDLMHPDADDLVLKALQESRFKDGAKVYEELKKYFWYE